MSKLYGYVGNILRVHLSKEKLIEEKLPAELAKGYIGGRGLNSRVLYDEVNRDVDPLDAENVLIFGVGPLNGTTSPSSGRWTVTAKSPLTNILGDANAGGQFGAELKYAGFDQIIVKGRAEKPVYLLVHDGSAEIRDARHLWGKTTWETEEIIKKEIGGDVKVACIGPAGENLVRFACIICDLSRAAGRCGLGAVMGSKRLKAIAVLGTKGVEVADPQNFEKFTDELREKITEDPVSADLSVYGTPRLVRLANEYGWLNTRNSQSKFFEKADLISGYNLLKKYFVRSKDCFGCVIHCSHIFAVKEGKYAGTIGEGPEFEGLYSLGSNCGISDLPSLLKAHVLCNQLGLDTISTGVAISFAIECHQRKIITDESARGLDLTWGNSDAMLELIRRIAYKRRGLGGLLADGVRKAAEKIGKGSRKFALHIKGLEPPAGSVAHKGNLLGFVTSTRGADHLRAGWVDTAWGACERSGLPMEKKPLLVKWFQEMLAVADSLETCKFNCISCSVIGPYEMARLYSLATGWEVTEKEILKIGERIYNVERAFNIREGITRKDEILPKRYKAPITYGPAKGLRMESDELCSMLDEYYELRGWDRSTGVPTENKLKKLGLSNIAYELEQLGKLNQNSFKAKNFFK